MDPESGNIAQKLKFFIISYGYSDVGDFMMVTDLKCCNFWAILRWIVILFWKFLAFVGISILVLSRQSNPDAPPCDGGGIKLQNNLNGVKLQHSVVRRQADVQQTVVS